jgi:4-hydroxybenzoate polyprenyltransferase
MIHDNEMIMLLLGIGALVLTLIYKAELKRIFAWKNLLVSFYFLLAACVFTVAEAFLWPYFLNLAEHLCYTVSAVIMAVWCFRVAVSHKRILF